MLPLIKCNYIKFVEDKVGCKCVNKKIILETNKWDILSTCGFVTFFLNEGHTCCKEWWSNTSLPVSDVHNNRLRSAPRVLLK